VRTVPNTNTIDITTMDMEDEHVNKRSRDDLDGRYFEKIAGGKAIQVDLHQDLQRNLDIDLEALPDIGSSEITLSVEKLQKKLLLPAWERLPASIETQKLFDQFGQVIPQLRSSPKQLSMCPTEPDLLHLFMSSSTNDLANSVFWSTLGYSLGLPEKLATHLMSYHLARVCLLHLLK
jgi:hypothetical protein